jgi:hypothetical protein
MELVMNELVLQLDREAVAFANTNEAARYEPKIWTNIYRAKFAQLLIGACVEIVMTDKGIGWVDSIRIKQSIEEAFGLS